MTEAKIFVGGLLPYSTDQSLVAYFSQFGEITEAKIVMDRQTGRSKNYGFVRVSFWEVFGLVLGRHLFCLTTQLIPHLLFCIGGLLFICLLPKCTFLLLPILFRLFFETP